MNKSEDFSLAQAAASGNETAREEIYRVHYRRVYSVCLRMSKNPTDAEDLTQEVFLQLFRKIQHFRGDAAFTTWLHRMAVNQCLMHFRKRQVKVEKTTEDGEMPEQIAVGTDNPLKTLVLDKIAIERAIAELPTGYRNALVLHDIEGYEHEEVAQILGWSVGTSKSQLHKARVKMRKLLNRTSLAQPIRAQLTAQAN